MISVNIRGDEELRRKLASEFAGVPKRNFLNRGGTLIQRHSREFAPVDRGTLRASIAIEIEPSSSPNYARIGPNVAIYGEAQEFGTRPFWPPKAPLEAWGARKGLTPRQVFFIRRKISRVGIKPKRYMQQGAALAEPEIHALLPVLAREIESAAAKGGR